ncbi:hypothetical protein PHLGIDRAFT_124212 [Phlebiopsis gigantea 11061_1 CR5-6]|uniref:Replication protein A subunit n=1 Tax=Phlebiopsis gigantea (strain 11061_1 CR5-6) TaxID=745531 RepID=A0A0C3SE15_PHLG1|nr:hypothetical protein PHLGIDRAFT_124212 [Phlebiopsis gigantea 11061_1 CR5-6]
MAIPELTKGICQRIHNAREGEENDQATNSHPTMQILSIKKVGQTTGQNATDRYRVIVSDGEYFLQAMLATQINALIESGDLTKNSIVVVDKCTCNPVADGKKLLIILELSVVTSTAPKIGNPVALQGPPGEGKPVSSASGTPVPQQQPQQTATSSSTMRPPTTKPTPAPPKPAACSRPNLFPIEGLSPYQNNWTIRAKVKQKSDIRTYSNQKGEGKFFSVTLMDDTGEIKATAFNQGVDELYPKLEEGNTYYISKARVNLAKKKFNTVNNDYELGLERSTTVEECHDGDIIQEKYDFVALDKLNDKNKDDQIDVLGIVKDCGELTEFTSKANNTLKKRELTIVDRSGASVRLTLWGRQAEKFEAEGDAIVAWKSVKVGDFGGRSLSMISTSSMEINPDIPDAHVLRGWYDAEGITQQFQPQTSTSFSGSNTVFNRSEIRYLDDVRNSTIGQEKPEYFSARATIMHIKADNIAYPACQSEGCSKKVTQQNEDEGWRCEKCDKVWPKPQYRYIMAMAVADHSGQAWFQGFNDVGNIIFGKSADELMNLKADNENEFTKVLEDAVGTMYNFTCRAKTEIYAEQSRVRYGVQKILPLNYKEEGNYLKELLSSPWAQQTF